MTCDCYHFARTNLINLIPLLRCWMNELKQYKIIEWKIKCDFKVRFRDLAEIYENLFNDIKNKPQIWMRKWKKWAAVKI
jgi:hypothetical protein